MFRRRPYHLYMNETSYSDVCQNIGSKRGCRGRRFIAEKGSGPLVSLNDTITSRFDTKMDILPGRTKKSAPNIHKANSCETRVKSAH